MNVDQGLLTMATVIATGVGTVLVQLYRESRNRSWEVKDRQDLADKLAADSATLALKLSTDNAALAVKLQTDQAEHLRQRRDADKLTTLQLQSEMDGHRQAAAKEHAMLTTLVAENTALTREGITAAASAYHEANQVNGKILTLEMEHRVLAERQTAVVGELAGIAHRRLPLQPGDGQVVDRAFSRRVGDAATLTKIEENTAATAVGIQKLTTEGIAHA